MRRFLPIYLICFFLLIQLALALYLSSITGELVTSILIEQIQTGVSLAMLSLALIMIGLASCLFPIISLWGIWKVRQWGLVIVWLFENISAFLLLATFLRYPALAIVLVPVLTLSLLALLLTLLPQTVRLFYSTPKHVLIHRSIAMALTALILAIPLLINGRTLLSGYDAWISRDIPTWEIVNQSSHFYYPQSTEIASLASSEHHHGAILFDAFASIDLESSDNSSTITSWYSTKLKSMGFQTLPNYHPVLASLPTATYLGFFHSPRECLSVNIRPRAKDTRITLNYSIRAQGRAIVTINNATRCLDNLPDLLPNLGLSAPAGSLVTIASQGLDVSGDPRVLSPQQIAIGPAGEIYVTENNSLFRFYPQQPIQVLADKRHIPSGFVELLWGGDGDNAYLSPFPANVRSIAVNSQGEVFFTTPDSVRKITQEGNLLTVAGGGLTVPSATETVLALNAQIHPTAIAFDVWDNLLIVEKDISRVRVVNTQGLLSTFAGDGKNIDHGDLGLAVSSGVANPYLVTTDKSGNTYLAEKTNGEVRLRKVDPYGIISTIYRSSSWPFMDLSDIAGMAVDGSGNIYLSDGEYPGHIWLLGSDSKLVLLAGTDNVTGLANNTFLASPKGMVVDSLNNLFFVEANGNRVRMLASGHAPKEGTLPPLTTPALFEFVIPDLIANAQSSIETFESGKILEIDHTGYTCLKPIPADQTYLRMRQVVYDRKANLERFYFIGIARGHTQIHWLKTNSCRDAPFLTVEVNVIDSASSASPLR